jgi:hypothetical protein
MPQPTTRFNRQICLRYCTSPHARTVMPNNPGIDVTRGSVATMLVSPLPDVGMSLPIPEARK